jgi:SOS-response transcriptional repressor LexA
VVGNRDVFALEVRGDSMRDEHIISGDYVLVERTRTARQGEIVVALVHGAETTLKRFYPEGSQVRLQPANIEMEPIYVPAPRWPSRAACWACCAIMSHAQGADGGTAVGWKQGN